MGDVEEVRESGLVCARKQKTAAALEAGNRTRQLFATEIRRELPGIVPLREQGNPLELLLRDRLEFIGVSLLREWDTLIFLYRHGVVLCSADQLARSLCCESAKISSVLDRLESQRLIESSRSSKGVRFYKVRSSNDSLQSSFRQLLSLTRNRAGRLMLAKILGPEARDAVQEVRSLTLSRKEVPHVR